MAIKNKIQANEYREGSPTSISAEKIKPLANAAIKKLTELGLGIKTSFFVEAGYFKDASGKPDGHFIAIGDSPSLEKEFKTKKTSPSIAYGNLFIEKEGDDEVVCFELVSGQGKLKKPADWKDVLRVFKKMVNKNCKLVTEEPEADDDSKEEEEEEVSNKAESETETPTERLERKAKIAADLMLEVVEITKIYDRDKKEKLLRKTTKWLNEYNALDKKEQMSDLAKQLPKIQKAYQIVDTILKTDDQITSYMNQIYAGLEEFLTFENHKDPKVKALSSKLIAAIDKVKPIIQKVKDNDLFEECESIQNLLKIAND